MDCTQVFDAHRNLLFSIAYRMLGLVMDAEDVVQDCYLKWANICSDEVESPKAYLSAMVTRLCIDNLRSAKVQREEYIGPWLPEPLITEDHPELLVTEHDSLSTAFLLMLENLNPIERAVFLLREVFDYEYAEIADILGKTEANCRQILRRARQHIDERERRFEVDLDTQQRILHQFLGLAATGDINGLVSLFTEDIVVYGDGGGKAVAAPRPVVGSIAVARFMIGLGRQMQKTEDINIQMRQVNGQIGVVISQDDHLVTVMTFNFDAENHVRNIYSVVNPDKLQRVDG